MVKMGTVEDHTQAKGAHKLTLSNRRTAGITGVSDVISFDISEVLDISVHQLFEYVK